MKGLLSTIFGIELAGGSDTAVTVLIAVQAALCVAMIGVLIALLVRRKKEKAQPAPAPAAEPEPQPEPAPAPEPEPEPEPAPVPVPFPAKGRVRYQRSYTAKYILSDDRTKEFYGELKNETLAYRRTRCHTSAKRESFYVGREVAVRFGYRGKRLCLYFPLDPVSFAASKYAVEDVSAVAAYADTPCLYRITSSRRVKYAKELIAKVMEGLGTGRSDRAPVDYYLPYEDLDALIARGLVKRVYDGGAPDSDDEETDALSN